MIKKILLLLVTVITVSAPVWARSDDMSKLEKMSPDSYFAARSPMLNGLSLWEEGITDNLTRQLDVLQIAVFSKNLDKPREEIRRLTRDLACGISMQTGRANIKVWGTPNDEGYYERVIIGIGARGKLTYIYMEGKILPQNLNMMLNIWME